MDELTVELKGSAARSVNEIAKLQHALPLDVANCAVLIGLEILRAEQDDRNGLVQQFIRSRQFCAAPPYDGRRQGVQEARKQLIMAGFGIWKELETTPKDGLQFQHEVRSEWS